MFSEMAIDVPVDASLALIRSDRDFIDGDWRV
jgi:hypothetical protein